MRAIADEVRRTMKHEHGLLPVGMEGTEAGKWVLVDYDDAVLHIFLEGARAFYDLEGLWDEAPREALPADVRAGTFADDDDDAPLFSLP